MAQTSLALLAPPAADAGPWAWRDHYRQIHIDIGTGDGRYALHLARQEPTLGVVGLDTNLDRIAIRRGRVPGNLHFVSADARAIPVELHGRASSLTVNFPYGGLLTGLLTGDDALLGSMVAAIGDGARLEVRVNARALAGTGLTLAEAGVGVERATRTMGLGRIATRTLSAKELRLFPSTWAKRIGFGRDAHAVQVTARADGRVLVPVTPSFPAPSHLAERANLAHG